MIDRQIHPKPLPQAQEAYDRPNEQRTRKDIEGSLRQLSMDIQTNITNLNTLIATLTSKGILP